MRIECKHRRTPTQTHMQKMHYYWSHSSIFRNHFLFLLFILDFRSEKNFIHFYERCNTRNQHRSVTLMKLASFKFFSTIFATSISGKSVFHVKIQLKHKRKPKSRFNCILLKNCGNSIKTILYASSSKFCGIYCFLNVKVYESIPFFSTTCI